MMVSSVYFQCISTVATSGYILELLCKRGRICMMATMGPFQPELSGKHGRICTMDTTGYILSGDGVMTGKHIDELNLSTCSLTDAKVALIGLHEMDVKQIDLSHNNQITAVGWAIIGKASQERL